MFSHLNGSKRNPTADNGSADRPAGRIAALGASDWLSLAAAPTFAIMALLTAATGGADMMICSSVLSVSPLSGMALMYLLMSAFHLAPWLKLVSSRRAGPVPS